MDLEVMRKLTVYMEGRAMLRLEALIRKTVVMMMVIIIIIIIIIIQFPHRLNHNAIEARGRVGVWPRALTSAL
jgi:hypothetical protein